MIAPREHLAASAPAATSQSDLTPQPLSRATRRFLWIFSIFMVLTAGSAFLIKLVEFLYQFSGAAAHEGQSASAAGVQPGFIFAIAPLLTYLIVAAGFACLFLWAYFSGQFRNVEGPKYRMLQMQHEIDQAETQAAHHRARPPNQEPNHVQAS